ncbi:major facilitator superfamily domain-containing protein [Mrakia frigida]|uniref:major facilitator superfamily domain-containing protein n=1 Tax=Mrakia frigida TaxID=29902 RepID=UPI003FCC082B
MAELDKRTSIDLARQNSRAHPSIRHGIPLHSFYDPSLDPERASSSETVVEDGSGVIHVEFELNDSRDPMSFSKTRKWVITSTAVGFTFLATFNLSSFAIGMQSMETELGLSPTGGALGIAVYAWAFGFAPLLLAPLSEEFGRSALYWVSCFFFAVFYIPVALAQNLETILVARVVQGIAGSTGSSLVGGTISDIWSTHERGLPMSLFALASIVGSAVGATFMAWVDMDPRLGWRWIQWINGAMTIVLLPLMFVVMKETRASVILTRMASKLRKETGKEYRSKAEQSRPPMLELIRLSVSRPFVMLFTEPVVALYSLWVGFAWGLLYGILDAIPYIFRTLYGFNTGQVGLAYLSIAVGGFLGFFGTFYQDRLFSRNFARLGPEARLYSACAGGILFPIGCYIFAWTSYPTIHWIAPSIGVTILVTGIFFICLCVFNYLADCYSIYSSSALAAQSFSRNMFGGAFPLFITPMYKTLNPRWAAFTFGMLGTVMAVIPFVLFRFGPQIRARSKFAKSLAELEK